MTCAFMLLFGRRGGRKAVRFSLQRFAVFPLAAIAALSFGGLRDTSAIAMAGHRSILCTVLGFDSSDLLSRKGATINPTKGGGIRCSQDKQFPGAFGLGFLVYGAC